MRVTVLYSKGSACEGDFVVRRVSLRVTVLWGECL